MSDDKATIHNLSVVLEAHRIENEALRQAAANAQTLLQNYLVNGRIPRGGDGDEAKQQLEAALYPVGNTLTPFGEAEAARMTPETEISYLRQQLQHSERQREEDHAMMERKLIEIGDLQATIRTLLRLLRDPAFSFWI